MEEFFKLPFEKRKKDPRKQSFSCAIAQLPVYYSELAVYIFMILISSFKWQFERYHNFQFSTFNFFDTLDRPPFPAGGG